MLTRDIREFHAFQRVCSRFYQRIVVNNTVGINTIGRIELWGW